MNCADYLILLMGHNPYFNGKHPAMILPLQPFLMNYGHNPYFNGKHPAI